MITGDEAGFDAFVAGRQAALSRTAYLLTGDHHLAQDLVQAALLQAARHWKRIHTSPEAYVRRAMYHQNISWWRRRRFAESPLLGHDGAAAAVDTDLRLTLDQALARLTAKQRTGELSKSASPMLMLGSCSCRVIEGAHGVRTTEQARYKL